MQYEEYRNIIMSGMVEYVNNGGSTFHIGNAVKEYFFEYDNELLPHDDKEFLTNKAVQAVDKKKPIPDGIRLVRCVWHGRRVQ